MGFMDSLKKATSSFVKSIRHKEFEIPAEELAEKWKVLRKYKPEIKVRVAGQDFWHEIVSVREEEVEVGIIRKSKAKRIKIKYVVHYDVEEYEEDEDEGWFTYRDRSSEIVTLDKYPRDKVEIRLSLANYEKMLEQEGEILK